MSLALQFENKVFSIEQMKISDVERAENVLSFSTVIACVNTIL